jgi:MFS family permease
MAFRNPFQNISRNTKILSLVSFFNDMASESIARILPLFLKETLKASFVAIGWVEGVADALSILLRLGSGWLSDFFARKKPLILFGYSASAITRPLLPWAITAFGWPGALVLKALDRVGKAVRVAPRDVLIASESHNDHRGEGFGLNRAMDTFGALLGVAFAAVLIAKNHAGHGPDDSISPTLFRWLILASSVFGFVAVGLIVFGVKEKIIEEASGNQNVRLSLWNSWKGLPKPFYLYLASVSLFCLAGSSDAFLLLKLRAAGFSLAITLLLIVGYNAVAALTAFPASRLSDRLSSRKAPLVFGWVIYALAYFLFAHSSNMIVLGAGFVWYGLYYGFVEATEKAVVADLAPKTHLGRAYGLFSFAIGFLVLPANLLFGWLADHYSMDLAMMTTAIIALAATLLLVLTPIAKPTHDVLS